jgi:hypothetical protein
MVLVFTRLFCHLGSKFGANTPFISHFEQICFFAKTGVIVKWEEIARIRFVSDVEWEKYMKFNHFKLAPKVTNN